MNIAVVANVLGTLVLAAGATMFFPLALSVILEENEAAAAFLVSAVLCLIVAFELKNHGLQAGRLSIREGIAITGLGWLSVSFLGMLPYVFGGYMNVLDGFTESVSGFSGTGATVLKSVEALPMSVLLWRSLTGWIGGLGIIVIFVAILPQAGRGSVFMMKAESTGPTSERQLPKIRDNAKALFGVYFIFTALCALSYRLCGMDVFAAVNHACSTIATGGFSVFDDGIVRYNSPALELCMAFFMLISSGSFALYLTAFNHGIKRLTHNTELRVYLAIVAVAAVLVFADLALETDMDLLASLRYAVFHVTSISSTTAYVINDFDEWPAFSKAVLLILMFIGGCAGSTSGGLKVSRVVLLFKLTEMLVKQKMHPQMITGVRLNGQNIPDEVMIGVARYFFAYIIVDIVFAMIMVMNGLPLVESTGVSISTMGSVGPGFGFAGATSTYEELPPLCKIAACGVMFLGRLEIFTVAVMFTPEFWRRKKGW